MVECFPLPKAQDLGMHRNSENWARDGEPIFSSVEQQSRKRIWYACVVMDKYVSAYIGRPLSIFEADYDTRLPSVEEVLTIIILLLSFVINLKNRTKN